MDLNLGLTLGLGLKLPDSDWFYYNQADMLLEKSENLFQLSVKQLVMQSRLAGLVFRGQAMYGMWKTKCKCCL